MVAIIYTRFQLTFRLNLPSDLFRPTFAPYFSKKNSRVRFRAAEKRMMLANFFSGSGILILPL